MGPNKFPVLRVMTASPADQMKRVNQLSNRSGRRLTSWIIVSKEAETCSKTKIIELHITGADPSGLHSLSLFSNSSLIHVSSAEPTNMK